MSENLEAINAATNVVYKSCLMLDDKDFVGWLETCCSRDFDYEITAYSPEIKKEMVWLKHDWEELKTVIDMLPKQNMDESPIYRHTTVYTAESDETSKEVKVVSSVAFFRTREEGNDPHLDTGQTFPFAVGKYYDTIDVSSETPMIKARTVKLMTRDLGVGCHWPL